MFRNMPIKTRLILSSIISSIALLLVAAVGLVGLYMSDAALKQQSSAGKAVRLVMEADMMHEGIEADVMAAMFVGAGGTAEQMAKARQELDDDIATFRAAFDGLADIDMPDDFFLEMEKVVPVAEDYLIGADRALTDIFDGSKPITIVREEFVARFETLEGTLSTFSDHLESRSLDVTNRAKTTERVLILALSGIVAATFIGLALNARTTINSVSKPIERLRGALRAVAEGDFDTRIGKITRDDDIGAIARDIDLVSDRTVAAMREQERKRDESEVAIRLLADGMQHLAEGNFGIRLNTRVSEEYESLRQDFNRTVEQLSDMIGEVISASEGILSRTTDINQAAAELSTRNETQASTLQETASALEELSTSVSSSAQNAKDADGVVTSARQDVSEGSHIVQGAVQAMQEIDASSSKISEIITVIEDISFQTNLLALNAGVEAARAGDAGRGFAVVAAEVRSLAHRTSEAAKEIATLIQSSAKQVATGVHKVQETGTSLSKIVAHVDQIAGLVSNIAASSAEQAQGLREINTGMAQLDGVTQNNAAMAEEAGASTQELRNEVGSLSQLVAQFRLTLIEDGDGDSSGAESFPLKVA